MPDATLRLTIDLNALNAGFKAALSMGQNFANQLNNVLSGKGMIDLQSFDRQLADYEAKLKAAGDQVLDVNEQPAVDGLTKTGAAAETAGAKIRRENLQNAASFAQVITGISSAINMFKQATSTIDMFLNKGVASKQANLAMADGLKYAGIYTDDYNKNLQKHIELLQKKIPVDDEEIKNNVQMLLYMHKFGSEELPSVIDNMIGASHVLDKDLNTTMKIFAKTAEGLPVRLADFGIALDKGGEETVNFNQLMDKGASGLQAYINKMQDSSGQYLIAKVQAGELNEALSVFMIEVLAPITSMFTALTSFLNDHIVVVRILLSVVGALGLGLLAYTLITKGYALATNIATIATVGLNTAMKANIIVTIISLLIGLGTLIWGLIQSMGGWSKVWGTVSAYAKASVQIMWEYIKGFWEFIKAFAGAIAMTLALPYKIMYDTAKEIFGKLAEIMKKLVKGDFKGVWDEITSGISLKAAESAQMVINQYAKAFDKLDGLGTKAKEIWAHALDTTVKVSVNAKPGEEPAASTGETEEQRAAREKLEQARAAAIESYYSTLKFKAADYEKYMLAKYDDERKAYIILTGDQAQADALYDEKARALTQERLDWEKQIREQAIKDERAPFEAAKAQIEEHLQRLQNWKELGLNVSQDLASTWTDYFNLLKSRYSQSEQQWRDASGGKVAVSAEELARLQTIYEQDKDNYLAALDKKKQADLKAMDDTIRKWKENNAAAVQAINGVKRGFDTMWDSILDSSMTGKQRLDNIWKSMLGSWMSSAGRFVADWLEKQAYMALMHGVFEQAKTAATVSNEAMRTGVHRASVMEALALDIWAAVKFVAIETWKAAASIFRYLAGLMGPFAIIAAAPIIAGLVAGIGAMRKGFKSGRYTGDGDPNEIAGAVHRKEFVFTEAATRGNINELNWLMNMLSGGVKLRQLIPNVAIPWMPVPQVAYSLASGGQANGDLGSMIRSVVREEMTGWQMSWDFPFTDKIRIILSKQVEKGGKMRKRLGGS